MVAATACAPDPGATEDPEAVALAVEGLDSFVRESSLLVPLAEAAVSIANPNAPGAQAEAARRAQALSAAAFAPGRCVTARAVGPTVSYVFNDCAGPFGLRGVSGSAAATFVRGALRPGVDLEAVNLRANGLALTLATAVEFDLDRVGAPVMRVTSVTTGVGARGLRFQRRGEHTVRWDQAAQCVTLDGQWSSTSGASATTTALRRCNQGCPEPGGVFRLERAALGEVVTLSFPGGSTALWRRTVAGADGGSGTFAMDCQN